MTIINTTGSPASSAAGSILGNGASGSSATSSRSGFTSYSDAETEAGDNAELTAIYSQQQMSQASSLDNADTSYFNPLSYQDAARDFSANAVSDGSENNLAAAKQAEGITERTLNFSTSLYSAEQDTNSAKHVAANPLPAMSTALSTHGQTSSATAFSFETPPTMTLQKPISGEGENLKFQTSMPQLTSLNVQRTNPQLAQQAQLQIQSVVSELSNIDSTNSASSHSQALAHAKTSQWGPIPVNTAAAMPQQGLQLTGPLREQVRFQIDHQVKQAEIRLDPPELGKLDMSVRLEGDRLQVQLHAATAQVRDALQSGIERLRSDLALDHGGQVDVNISYGEQESKQQANDEFQVIAAVDSSQSEQQEQSTSELDVRA